MKLINEYSFKLMLAIALLIGGWACIEAQFAGGSGTEEDPWQIESAEHLDNLRNYLGEEHGNKHFIQTANISLSNYLWDDEEDDYINEGEGWLPIGTEENSFHGQYNGDGHTIAGLYVSRPNEDLQGLFGKTVWAVVSNLGLSNIDVTGNNTIGAMIALSNNTRIRNCFSQGSVLGKGNEIGGLVGENNHSLIADSYCSGTVKGEMMTGGLIGYSLGATVENCYTTNNVKGISDVGGLVGQSNDSTIDGCYSTGDITGQIGVGGLIGLTLVTSTTNSYSIGIVEGDEAHIGGLIGNNTISSFVERCYNKGTVKGKGSVMGGLIGNNFHSTVSNSYNTGTVLGSRLVGGLVGYNRGRLPNEPSYVTYSYSTGYVRGDAIFGGLVGQANHSEVNSSYWNLETSGQNESAGGTGLTTRTMTRQSSFDGWNFNDIWSQDENVHYPFHSWQETADFHNYPGPHSLISYPNRETFEVELNWQMQAGSPLRYNIYRNDILLDTVDYPIMNHLDDNVPEDEIITYYITAIMYTPEHGEFETTPSNWITIGPLGKFAGGNGSINNPWRIGLAEHLHNVRFFLGKEHSNKHFIQTSNIDLTNFLWDEEEEDYIDEGKGWSPIGKDSDEMFFSGTYNGNGHIVEGLYINRPDEDNLGLFGFTSYPTIKNLGLRDINIKGNSYIGGLVGHNYSPTSFFYISTIDNCFVSGNINARKKVGGLVGAAARNDSRGINNSYSKVNITGENKVGGLLGHGSPVIFNCYSTGIIEGDANTGGLVGAGHPLVTNSYWDIETSGQESSRGGEGRTTRQMTYPYGEETYSDWNFEKIWGADVDNDINSGYPYLNWQVRKPYPLNAVNPFPVNDYIGVTVNLEGLRWDYIAEYLYTDPLGFRVYFNNTGEFGDDDDFDWVPYIEDQVEYRNSDILPDSLEYETEYYWQVVPTTRENGTGDGEDAQDVPVWTFRTEIDTSVEEHLPSFITELGNNYPNPFNPETVIEFSIAKDTNTAVTIYNTKGQLVKTLHNGLIKEGEHRLIWDGRDEQGRETGSGVYFYRLKTEHYNQVNKMLLIK